MENNPIDVARHRLNNCRSAFRLLQGGLLSGKISYPQPLLIEMAEKFIRLEIKAAQDPKSFDRNDPKWDDIFLFFLSLNSLKKNIAYNSIAYKGLANSNLKLLIVDDLVEDAGWHHVFKGLLGAERILIAKSKAEADKIVAENLHGIFSVLVDINIGTQAKLNEHVLTKHEGLLLIEEWSLKFPQLPLVAFTAYDSSIVAKLAFEKGAWDYFTKEPTGAETKEWRNAIEYLHDLLKILDKHITFSTHYSELFKSTNHVIDLITHKVPHPFCNLIKKNLLLSLKYLSMDDTLRFKPSFLEFDRFEEVVFQATKALDTFLTMLLQVYQIYPAFDENHTPLMSPTMGPKLTLLKNDPRTKTLFDKKDLKLFKQIRASRNKNTHQEELKISYSGKGRNRLIKTIAYQVNVSPITEDDSKTTFKNVLNLIENTLRNHLKLSHDGTS